ncbi:hypothetical protein A0H81_09649 [Grifola frondosa]|uniref:Uncharacterized protein n=1 Tax=Grifola frondosa TaxID=5627 RepID=A0A1C7M1Y7_GRIFR|nr:hypothetical protein A0H81_09649 [Grifola frondosa]
MIILTFYKMQKMSVNGIWQDLFKTVAFKKATRIQHGLWPENNKELPDKLLRLESYIIKAYFIAAKTAIDRGDLYTFATGKKKDNLTRCDVWKQWFPRIWA